MRQVFLSMSLLLSWSHAVAYADALPMPGRPEFDDTPLPMPSEPELVALAIVLGLALGYAVVYAVARTRKRAC